MGHESKNCLQFFGSDFGFLMITALVWNRRHVRNMICIASLSLSLSL